MRTSGFFAVALLLLATVSCVHQKSVEPSLGPYTITAMEVLWNEHDCGYPMREKLVSLDEVAAGVNSSKKIRAAVTIDFTTDRNGLVHKATVGSSTGDINLDDDAVSYTKQMRFDCQAASSGTYLFLVYSSSEWSGP